MAEACINEQINFSYLHIISDNLKKKYDEDLSNERKNKIINKRDFLYTKIKKFLIQQDLL